MEIVGVPFIVKYGYIPGACTGIILILYQVTSQVTTKWAQKPQRFLINQWS